MKVFVERMLTIGGSSTPDHIIIHIDRDQYFQSFDKILAVRYADGEIVLDPSWKGLEYIKRKKAINRYRSAFLDEPTEETAAKVKSGEYEVKDLNQ